MKLNHRSHCPREKEGVSLVFLLYVIGSGARKKTKNVFLLKVVAELLSCISMTLARSRRHGITAPIDPPSPTRLSFLHMETAPHHTQGLYEQVVLI